MLVFQIPKKDKKKMTVDSSFKSTSYTERKVLTHQQTTESCFCRLFGKFESPLFWILHAPVTCLRHKASCLTSSETQTWNLSFLLITEQYCQHQVLLWNPGFIYCPKIIQFGESKFSLAPSANFQTLSLLPAQSIRILDNSVASNLHPVPNELFQNCAI